MEKNKKVRYLDDNWKEHHGTIEEINGNMAYIVDDETGDADWYARFEWEYDR